jgi:uncharacterized protein YoxC
MTLRTALVIDGDSASGKRALEELNSSIAKSEAQAQGLARSLGQVDAAASKASGGGLNAIQRESAQISQFTKTLAADMVGIGDLLSSEHSPFVAPVKKAPAVTGAIEAVAGSAGILGTVLETAATGGVALLALSLIDLIPKLHGTTNEVDELVKQLKEHHDKALLAEQAQSIYSHTVDGSIDGMKKLTDEIRKQNLTLEDNINLKKAAIAASLGDVVSNIGSTSSDLAKAIQARNDAAAEMRRYQGAVGDPDVAPDIAAAYAQAASDFAAAKQQVIDLTAQLNSLNKAANDGAKALNAVNFPLVERNARDAVDPIAAINHRFDDMAAKAKAAGTYTQAFANDLEKQRKAALDSAQANERLSRSAGEYGRQISFADAAAIANGAGLTVTSGYRQQFGHGPPGHRTQEDLYNDLHYNRPGNPVAAPGTSAHGGINGKWALDIAFAPGLTAQSLKKLYGDQGVALSAVYKESGHFHIEGSQSQAAAAERADQRAADKAAADAKKAAELKTAQNDNFAQQSAQLDSEILSSRGQLLGSIDDQSRFALEQVQADQNAYALSLQKSVDQGRLREEQTKELLLKSQAVADQQRANIAVHTFLEKQDDLQKTIDQDYGLKIESLRYQGDMARTARERRDIALRIIDLEYQQRDADLRIARAKAIEAQKWEEVARIDKQIAALPGEKAQDQGRANQSNLTPLQQFFADTPKNAEDLDAALEKIAVGGLQKLNDGLVDAILHSKSLKDVFHSVAESMLEDLIKLALKEAEMALFSAIFGSAAVGGGGGGGGGGGFGGGFASGGDVQSGTTYLVGEKGPELFVPSSNGTIVPNHKLRSGGMTPANDTGSMSVSIVNHNDFSGADPQSEARIMARLDQMEREMPGRTLKVMQNARTRFAMV